MCLLECTKNTAASGPIPNNCKISPSELCDKPPPFPYIHTPLFFTLLWLDLESAPQILTTFWLETITS